jgi:hypothetical protein
MAIIYSYPLTTPKVKDLLIGTSVFDEDDENSPRNNPTVSFTIKSLLDMIGTGGFQTLQQVTNLGASTTNAITIANGLSVTGTFTDSTGGVGTAGQVLSSTSIGTAWINDNAGLNYYVTGAAFDTTTGILAITGNNALVGASIDLDGRYMSSLTTTGTTGASTFNAVTGVLNIPNYVGGVTSVNSSLLFAYKGILVTPTSGAVVVGLNINDLPSLPAAIADEDVMVIVDDPSGTGAGVKNHKTTVGDLKTHINTNTTYDYLAVGSIPSGTVNSPPMGSGYSSAINVATTGGSGTGMTVDTTVDGAGGVQTVTINNPGTGYAIGDNNIVISGGDGGLASQAIISLSGTVGETNPNLRLVDSAFAFDDVKLTGSGGTTITRTSDTGITISSTEADTLQTVTARGATTAVASTFSGGLTSSGILTCNGAGANAYSYFTGNGGGAIPPSSFTHGMTQVWNNSSGSREWETFWATGADIEGDPAVPADGHAANAISYMSGYNRYAGASTSGTPVDTRMYKWYGNGELEILDMSTLPGGNARPTVSTPYITLPLSAGTNNSMLVRKSTKEVEFSASLSYNEALATLAILPASGTPSEIQMKSADNSIWKLAISNAGALVITGPF